MAKRLKGYLKLIEMLLSNPEKIKNPLTLKQELLIQISFFQHERLIHLIVTVLFALATVMSFLCMFFVQEWGLLLLAFAILILLVPYIKHYYLLENGVQKLYSYYDKLQEIIDNTVYSIN